MEEYIESTVNAEPEQTVDAQQLIDEEIPESDNISEVASGYRETTPV